MHQEQFVQRKIYYSYFLAFLFIIGMVSVADILHDKEIILPEIAAMAIAFIVYRNQHWMKHPEKIFFWPSVTALIGFAVNLLAIPFAAKLALTLVLMLSFFYLFRYNLAPALATGFLPVVTNATEYSFIASIFITTLLLMLSVMVFKLKDNTDRKVMFSPRPLVIYAVLILLSIVVGMLTGYVHLSVLPPVAVVLFESINMKNYSRNIFLKQVAVLVLSSLMGVIFYLTISNWIFVIILDLLAVGLLLSLFKFRLPAAYAFPLLAYVLPNDILPVLPVAAFLVSFISLGLVLLFKNTIHPSDK